MKFRWIPLCIALVGFQSVQALADNPLQSNRSNTSAQQKFKFPKNVTEQDYMPKTLIVKFHAENKTALSRNSIAIASVQSLMQKIAAKQTQQIFPNSNISTAKGIVNNPYNLTSIYRIQYTADIPLEDVINEFLQLKEVQYAEPSYVYRLSYIPNDPDTNSSRNYYQKIIKAYEAWNVNKGSSNVVIGIIDTGGDLDHPDLAANVKYNTADPVDGLDNDNDGYVDNYAGWDFVGASTSTFIADGDPSIKAGGNDHGVHVGGDASAVADNGVGIAGVGFNSKLLFVKCTPDNYDNGVYTGYEGIAYAADMGAQIINCSWGGPGGGQLGQDVINYATAKGSLIVAAAGNNGQQMMHYPSAYKNVLAVASSTSADRKSSFSNYGYWIDVSAPGSSIYSTTYNNSYNSYDGTSMASPIAAGAAALVKAQFPNYTPGQVAEQLRVTADDINSLNNAFRDKIGKGRINVYKALTMSSPAIRYAQLSLFDNNSGAFLPGDTITLTMNLMNYLQATSNLNVSLSTSSSFITITQANANAGVIGTLQTKNVGTFKIFIKPTTPDNTVVPIKITYTDGSYTDYEYIELELNITAVNIQVNQIASTATGNGRVGYRNGDATGGLGVVYKGESMLYEAAFMVASSNTKVSDNARTETNTPNEHFVTTTRIKRAFTQGVDFFASGEFDDSANPNPLNIAVKHRELAWSNTPDDKYFIVEYRIRNKNNQAMTNLFAGMFFDWDVVDAGANKIIYDANLRMAYCQTFNAANPMVAVKILNTNVSPAYYGQSYEVTGDPQENGYSTAEKYTTLSSGIVNPQYGTTAPGLDVMYTIGAGPYTVNSNESALLSLAIIAGDDLNDLIASANAAQQKYDQFVTTLGIESEENKLKVLVYPNPAKDKISIAFPIELNGIQIEIFDAMGKKVWDSYRSDINDTYVLEGIDLAKGMYHLKITNTDYSLSEKLIIE